MTFLCEVWFCSSSSWSGSCHGILIPATTNVWIIEGWLWECSVCVGSCGAFRAGLAERQLNILLEGWLEEGKWSCQWHHTVCHGGITLPTAGLLGQTIKRQFGHWETWQISPGSFFSKGGIRSCRTTWKQRGLQWCTCSQMDLAGVSSQCSGHRLYLQL